MPHRPSVVLMSTSVALVSLMVSLSALQAHGTLEKGVIYVQPSYHYTNTLDLDLEVFRRDVATIAAGGFKNVGLRVSFGELITRWNSSTKVATYNETKCAALGEIARAATSHGIRLIFNTHLLDTVPQGIDGAYFVGGGGPDVFGVTGGDGHNVWRSHYTDVMVRESYREPMLLFHRKFASCFRDTPTAPHYWKHAFESCYIFPDAVPSSPGASLAMSAATSKFSEWARDTNPSLQHWRERWDEPALASFDNITLPSKPNANKAKNGDFWRFWLIGVLKDGRVQMIYISQRWNSRRISTPYSHTLLSVRGLTDHLNASTRYGMSIGDIHAALQDGAGSAYDPLLAFKHWKPANFESTSDLTHEELVDAFDLPINATALGYYVNDATTLAQEPSGFSNYIDSVRSVAPSSLPVIVWETGGSTFNLTLPEQATWAKMMMATAESKGVKGFNWWQFVDWAPYPAEPCDSSTPQGVTHCELFHYGAHFLNRTAKPVWTVLVSNAV